MESTPLLDCRAAPVASDNIKLPPRALAQDTGLRYPPDPPTAEEIVAVMRAAGDSPEGVRLRGLIVVLGRAGLRISQALALSETDRHRAATGRPTSRMVIEVCPGLLPWACERPESARWDRA